MKVSLQHQLVDIVPVSGPAAAAAGFRLIYETDLALYFRNDLFWSSTRYDGCDIS